MCKQNKTNRYRKQIGSFKKGEQGVEEMREGGQEIQIFSHKISHGDVMDSMVTTVSNVVLHVMKHYMGMRKLDNVVIIYSVYKYQNMLYT